MALVREDDHQDSTPAETVGAPAPSVDGADVVGAPAPAPSAEAPPAEAPPEKAAADPPMGPAQLIEAMSAAANQVGEQIMAQVNETLAEHGQKLAADAETLVRDTVTASLRGFAERVQTRFDAFNHRLDALERAAGIGQPAAKAAPPVPETAPDPGAKLD